MLVGTSQRPVYSNLPHLQLADTFVQLANVYLGDIQSLRMFRFSPRAWSEHQTSIVSDRILPRYCELYFSDTSLCQVMSSNLAQGSYGFLRITIR